MAVDVSTSVGVGLACAVGGLRCNPQPASQPACQPASQPASPTHFLPPPLTPLWSRPPPPLPRPTLCCAAAAPTLWLPGPTALTWLQWWLILTVLSSFWRLASTTAGGGWVGVWVGGWGAWAGCLPCLPPCLPACVRPWPVLHVLSVLHCRYGAYRRTLETTAEAQAWEHAKQAVG